MRFSDGNSSHGAQHLLSSSPGGDSRLRLRLHVRVGLCLPSRLDWREQGKSLSKDVSTATARKVMKDAHGSSIRPDSRATGNTMPCRIPVAISAQRMADEAGRP